MVDPEKVYLYHITSIDNLPSIIKGQGLKSKSRLLAEDIGHRNIAYGHIQQRRARHEVPCASGGCLHDYVPFYFGPRSPMLYAIHGGYVDRYDDGQQPILHLVTKVSMILEEGLSYAFTDRHAVLALAEFYDDPESLNQVDHSLMYENDWSDTPQHPNRKEKRQAEFLVYDFMPLNLIGAIGVINEEVKDQVMDRLKLLDEPPPVIVRQKWYYEEA